MKYSVLLCSAALLTVSTLLPAASGPGQLELPWTELGAAIADAKIALVLPSGTHIQGKVLSVDADAIRLHVSKTSDKKDIAKGDREIPRQSVSFVQVTRYSKVGRIACTLGLAAALGLAVAVQDVDVYEGPAVAIVPAVTAAGVAGGAVGGYYIGKRLDRHVTEIRIKRQP